MKDTKKHRPSVNKTIQTMKYSHYFIFKIYHKKYKCSKRPFLMYYCHPVVTDSTVKICPSLKTTV